MATGEEFEGDEEVSDIGMANDTIRQLKQIIRDMGGLKVVRGSEVTEVQAGNSKLILDPSKVNPGELFAALRNASTKNQKIEFEAPDGVHITGFKSVE